MLVLSPPDGTRTSTILTRDQQQRLMQIEMWTLGLKMFLRDELPRELELPADGVLRIKPLR